MLKELIGGVPKYTNCGQDENGARDVCLLATTKILVERRRQVRAFSTWSHLRILDAILPTDHRTGTITVCFALQSRFYLLFSTPTHTFYTRESRMVLLLVSLGFEPTLKSDFECSLPSLELRGARTS